MSDTNALVAELAVALSEPKTTLLRAVVAQIGEERTRAHLAAALAIEAAGGELTVEQNRRRTPGGVFFRLVRADCSAEEREALFPTLKGRRGKRTRGTAQVTAPANATVETALSDLQKGEKGTTIVKMTLIGRPIKTAQVGDSMLCQMMAAPPGDLPKGLPQPPANAVGQSYVVFIAMPAWRKVAGVMADADDALIIEGWPWVDQQRGLFVVLAKGVTTKKIQRAQREKQATK